MLPYTASIDWEFVKNTNVEESILAAWIEGKLMGDMSYIEATCRAHDCEPIEVELSILRGWGGYPTMQKGPYGKYWHQHFANYLKLLIPGTFISPWLVDECRALEIVISQRLDLLNLIGSKSSGKSAFMARAAIGLVTLDHEHTGVFAAAPYKNAAQYTIWGEFRDCFDSAKERHPWLFEGAEYRESDQAFVFGEKFYKSAARIELVCLDQTGKLQGMKARDPERGYLIVIADEIGVFPSDKFMDILANINANDNLLVITGCNYRSISGMEGQLCKPYMREYSELNIEIDHEWRSDHSSYTVRLDGHYQPNVLANKVIYTRLLREHKRKNMEEQHGLKGPKYLEQVRSFPNNSMSDYYVTTREKIRSSGGYSELEPEGPTVKVAFCDPGFGGDPCKIAGFEFGAARVYDSDGKATSAQIFRPLTEMETIILDVDQACDAAWVKRVQRVSANPSMLMNFGEKVSLEQQIAVQAAEFLSRHSIPRTHFGYDGSMRASVVTEMATIIGLSCHAIDFGGQATERTNPTTGEKTAREMYFNFVTEMYFNVANVVHCGGFRGADMIPTAVHQICRRVWWERDKKKQIQPKTSRGQQSGRKGYKEENQGRSPDDADVWAGGLEMALRKGFLPPLMKKGKTKGSANPRSWNDVAKKLTGIQGSPFFNPTSRKLIRRP